MNMPGFTAETSCYKSRGHYLKAPSESVFSGLTSVTQNSVQLSAFCRLNRRLTGCEDAGCAITGGQCEWNPSSGPGRMPYCDCVPPVLFPPREPWGPKMGGLPEPTYLEFGELWKGGPRFGGFYQEPSEPYPWERDQDFIRGGTFGLYFEFKF